MSAHQHHDNLPPQAHALAAQIDDELEVWNRRDLTRPRPDVLRSGERASRLADDLISVFDRFRRGLADDIGEYRDAMNRS